MISEGSCDTEGWSNDAEKFSFASEINYILKYIQIENSKNLLPFNTTNIYCNFTVCIK